MPRVIRRALAFSACVLTIPLVVIAQTSSPPDSAALYRQRCSSCHGKDGRGDGEYAGLLNPRPRDFTSGRFKFRSTETGSLPTDDDLARSITEGLHGTSMPAWKPFLSPEQVRALIAQVKSFSPRFASEQPKPITMSAEPPESPQNVEAGRAVYDKMKCAACHGTDGRGTGAIAQAMRDDWGQPTRATNLAEPWTFRGGNTVRDIFLRFRTGMNGTPMPSFLGAATEPELWQLAVYVKSLGRKPLWDMKGDEVAAFYRDQEQEAKNDVVRHGEYIATVTGCAFCHSPFRDDNTMIDDLQICGRPDVRGRAVRDIRELQPDVRQGNRTGQLDRRSDQDVRHHRRSSRRQPDVAVPDAVAELREHEARRCERAHRISARAAAGVEPDARAAIYQHRELSGRQIPDADPAARSARV